jgi:hypothetical protein
MKKLILSLFFIVSIVGNSEAKWVQFEDAFFKDDFYI